MSDDLDDAIAELIVLWPALPTALPRDAGVQTGERVTTSENVHNIPLNADVADVILDLTRNIPEWTRWAAEAANMTPVGELTHQLEQLPAIHHRLLELGRTHKADTIATIAHGWLDAARRALGLNRPDRHFGEHCPRHDQPLTPLVLPGEHVHLRYTKLDHHGQPVDPTIEWQRVEIVLCRHCNAMWTPERYMLLGRLIRQARRDREHAQADDAA